MPPEPMGPVAYCLPGSGEARTGRHHAVMTDFHRGSDGYRRLLELACRSYLDAVHERHRPRLHRVVGAMNDDYGLDGLRDMLSTLLVDLAPRWPQHPPVTSSTRVAVRSTLLVPDVTTLVELFPAYPDDPQRTSGVPATERALDTLARVQPVVQAALEHAVHQLCAPATDPTVHRHLAALTTIAELAAAIHLVGSVYTDAARPAPATS